MTDEQAKAFYKSWGWKKCREIILKRDNYLCQRCIDRGELTAAKIVHHVQHLKDNPLLALEESNLVSVCNTCHEQIHNNRGGETKDKTLRKPYIYNLRGNDNIV